MTVPMHTGDDRKFGRLLCIAVHCLMMGPWGLIIVRVCVLKHCCDSGEVCVFVDLHCNN